ncbi:MAG: TetR/AcrR family transcriptional regulator [Chloroflexi bacterium]|nr:TetR/AcrR family transcriptional regulator [Chloroflexota bacterium]
MPKAFTEREKQLIRRRLLSVGDRQFSAHGLKKTSIEDLAEAVGISKGAFYIFYPSKEALFMDVVEQAKLRFRQEILAAVDLPGSSPRVRLLAVLKKAFSLVKTIPILQFFTGNDYDLLIRRIPEGKLQEHLAGDRQFFEELVAHCKDAGIPIRVRPEEISGLLYPLVLTVLHDDASSPISLGGNIDLLLELVAAFCLGEVDVQTENPIHPTPQRAKGYPG